MLARGCGTVYWRVASARRRDRTVQTASKDVSVCARLRCIATFVYRCLRSLLTYLLTFCNSAAWHSSNVLEMLYDVHEFNFHSKTEFFLLRVRVI